VVGPGLRFALEAAFLIALAVAAGLAELSPTTIVLVMGAAWLLVAVIEWLAWREAPRVVREAREEVVAVAPQPVAPVAEAEAEPRRRFWRRRRPADEAQASQQPGEDTQDLAPPTAEEPEPVSADERT
jgi:flagellar biosynthesis/type III secretory pathway M-ring protein FliF/YscJ